MRNPSPRSAARITFATLLAIGIALPNMAAGCPGDGPPAIDLPELASTAAVGTLAGSSAVSDDGTFSYTIPIPIPPGRAGMQPRLAISYASTPAESSLGVGFRLDGLSAITRCGQSVAVDGQHHGVHLDEEDRLCLDGARLLAVEGADLSPGAVYRTESESWRRVETLSSDAGGISGPVRFLVRLPDGRERLYGATNGSQQVITRADGTRVVSTWYLAQERDPRGNAIQYRYEHVTPTLPPAIAEAADPDPPVHDTVRIARIDYTGTASADGAVAVTGTRSVRFSYAAEPRVPDAGAPSPGEPTGGALPEDGFMHGSYGWRAAAEPLERVQTFVDGTLAHELRLSGNDDNAARRFRLSSAQLCASAPAAPGSSDPSGLVCLPPTRFSWRDLDASGLEIVDTRYGRPTFESRALRFDAPLVTRRPCEPDEGGPSRQCDAFWPTVALDANGDGADDLLYLRQPARGGASRLSLRYGRFSPRRGASFGPIPESEVPLSWVSTTDVVLVPDRADRDVAEVVRRLEWADSVDWNADGRDDLVLLVPAPGEDLWELIVAVAETSARFRVEPSGVLIPRSVEQAEFHDGGQAGELDAVATARSVEVLDLNGDGRRDIMTCLNDSAPFVQRHYFDGNAELTSTPGRWWYALRNPDGTLGTASPAGRRRLTATSIETNCSFERRGLERVTGRPAQRGVDFPYYDFEARVLDADGDGMEELLIAPPWYTELGERAPSNTVRRAYWDGSTVTAASSDVPNERFQVADVNGDGLHDLVAEHASIVAPALAGEVPDAFDQVLTVVYVSRGDGRFVPYLPSIHMPDRRRARFRTWLPSTRTGRWSRWPLPLLAFDANGDGRGDLLSLHLAPDEVRAERADADFGNFVYRWADSEVAIVEFLASSRDVVFDAGFTVPGDQHFGGASPLDRFYASPLVTQSLLLDADGDGALDLLEAPRVGAQERNVQNPFPRSRDLRLRHNVRAQPSLIERVTDGLGAETVVFYTPLSDASVYRASRDCTYPTRCTTDSRYVVQRVWQDDGSDGRAYVEEEHVYQGGRVDLLGRGFLGFQRHAIRNTITNEVVDRRFDNQTYDPATRSYPLAGQPRAVMHYRMHTGALPESPLPGHPPTHFVGTKETFERRLVVTDVGTHYTVTSASRVRAYEEVRIPLAAGFGGDPFLGLSAVRDASRTLTYDPFGNPQTVVERIAGVPGTTVTSSTWVNDTDLWRIGLPGTHAVRTNETDQACSLRVRTSYEVDLALGEVMSVTRLGDGDPSLDRTTSVSSRDRWGNVTGVITTSAEEPRSVSLTYDPTGYFMESATNALGHVTSLRHEPRFGALVRTTDPNGVETTRSFDGFGRLRAERTSGRGGAVVTYDLADEVGRHQVRVDAETGESQVVEYDRLGRAVASEVEHAFVTSYAHRGFDRLGRLAYETVPYTDPAERETAARTEYVYDDLSRPLTTTGPEGERTDFVHPRNERHTTQMGGGTYVTELDPAGRILAAVEPGPHGGTGGRTTYQYCRSGALRRTWDPASNETVVEYDDVGRRTFLSDPAAGVATFSYTALDELASTTDAEGRVSRWRRDTLGRTIELINEADATVDRFFFDTAVTPGGRPVLGALGSSESGDGVIDTYEFDDLARATGQSRLVDGRLLRFSTALDSFGRVLTTQYPDALGLGVTNVQNFYDTTSGEPYEVRLNGAAVWRLRDQDPHGMPTRETLGSSAYGIVDRTSDYTDGGRLEARRSTVGLTTVLQDLSYAYDRRGLLASRNDALAPRFETYEYDHLSRLESVIEDLVETQSYTVDAIGNLTSTHDGRLAYTDSTRPYAATELDGPEGGTFLYDDVGNVYQAGELMISYTQRNLPRTISSSKTGNIEYRYDAGGGRASKRSRDVDITYFGPYEIERRGMLVYERISIATPVGVVAQLERTGVGAGGSNGQSRLRWLLTERQGSVETTWVNGEAAEHHRYDAYGGVLAEGGSVTGERPSPSVSQGYTGHEHEDEIGLVNMGGRIYSPRLRRFLSADPIVAVPFGQGLNAYSYVMGDPMNLTDPTGWQASGRDLRPGPNGEQPTIIIGRVPAPSPVGDGPGPERGGAAPAGQAPAQATDQPAASGGARQPASPTSPARALGSPQLHRITADDMAAAAQIIEDRGTLRVADGFAHLAVYVGGAALGAFAAAEVAGGGVMQVALAAEETSVGASQAISLGTQIMDGILADVGGGGVAVPALAGAAGVGVRVLGQVGDDIGRSVSRASAEPRGLQLALGLARHGVSGAPLLLRNFAARVGALTYGDVFGSWWPGSYEQLRLNLLQAMRSAERIHFNLDGVSFDTFRQFARQGGAFGADNITNWELITIMYDAELLAKTTFYGAGGAIVDAPILP